MIERAMKAYDLHLFKNLNEVDDSPEKIERVKLEAMKLAIAAMIENVEDMRERCALRLEAAAVDNEEMLDPHPINFQCAEAYRQGAELIRALEAKE